MSLTLNPLTGKFDVISKEKIVNGSAQGQMSFWDDTLKKWTYIETSEMFWDDTNKRLGIGTATPTSSLHIKGSGDSSGTSSLNVTNLSGTSLLYARNDGYIGINTTSPTAPLQINQKADNIGFRLYGYDDMSSESFVLYINSTGYANVGMSKGLYYEGTESFTFRTGAGKHMYFDLGGLFYIRDADNSYTTRFQVRSDTGSIGIYGSAVITNSISILKDNFPIVLGAGKDASIDYDGTDFVFDSRVVGTGDFIFKNGNVGIGTTTPTEKLEIDGNLFLNGDNDKVLLGTGKDASIYYDGTNLNINPKEVGTGILDILGTLQTDGYNSSDGSAGVTGSFVDNGGNTITVKNGLITNLGV